MNALIVSTNAAVIHEKNKFFIFDDKILQDEKRKMSVQEKWQIFFFLY